MDWSDPEARLNLIERVGVDRYNALKRQHDLRSTVATVNGHGIRPVATMFGRLFFVDGTKMAFQTLTQAEAYAREIDDGETV